MKNICKFLIKTDSVGVSILSLWCWVWSLTASSLSKSIQELTIVINILLNIFNTNIYKLENNLSDENTLQETRFT